MQMGFYFNQSRCTGCYTCIVACKDWHDVPAGPANWIRVATLEKGKYPNVSVSFMFLTCYHCAEPLCISACPVDAIAKSKENGIVEVDTEKCLGKDACALCRQACPYGAPQFGAEENAKMQKCNFCVDRLMENKEPICVAACPLRALDARPLDNLKARYGSGKEAEGFVYSLETKPSIIFTHSRHLMASNAQKCQDKERRTCTGQEA